MARASQDIRDDFLSRTNVITTTRTKLVGACGRGQVFTFPESHKIHEGFLLSVWTSWESMVRELFISDLALSTDSALRRDIKASGFRLKGSPDRLADLIVGHPDEHRFVEWNRVDDVVKRANALLGPGHRFTPLNQQPAVIEQIVKSRNAIAHRSDQAWSKFKLMVQNQPYGLQPREMRGITVGRFLSSNRVNGQFVIEYYIDELRSRARLLVP